MSIGYLSTL